MIDTNRPVRHMSYKGNGKRLVDMIRIYPNASITAQIINKSGNTCYYRCTQETISGETHVTWECKLPNEEPTGEGWMTARNFVEYRDGILINAVPYDAFIEHTEAGHLNCNVPDTSEKLRLFFGAWRNINDENNN